MYQGVYQGCTPPPPLVGGAIPHPVLLHALWLTGTSSRTGVNGSSVSGLTGGQEGEGPLGPSYQGV